MRSLPWRWPASSSRSTAVYLAAERGKAMAEASAIRPTGMCAVLGGDEDEVLPLRRRGLELAIRQRARAARPEWPDRRPRRLPAARRCAGAAARHRRRLPQQRHAAGRPALQALVACLTAHDATVPVIANADGALVTDGRELLDRLVGQLTGAGAVRHLPRRPSPASEPLCMELAPAGTLTAIAKRAGLDTVALSADLRVNA